MILRCLAWLLALPLQVALLALFAMADLARLLAGPRRAERQSEPVDRTACSIVVLNWNGRELLAESLPALERAVAFDGASHEIIVVDNGSQDGSADWIRSRHPAVRVIELKENLGFGEGNNKGVEAAQRNIVVLLNNDMVVEPDFLRPLLDGFADPSVFAVSSQIHFPPEKRREETGYTRGEWRRGYLHLAHADVTEACHRRKYLPVLWAGGGSSAFDRRRFLQLGGFAKVFSPCYLEDTDLCYRAWRRGWKVLFTPQSQVLHKHRSSSAKRFDIGQLNSLVEQRKLWYVWRNYQLSAVARHLLGIPLNFRSFLRIRDYLSALKKLPSALANRIKEPRRVVGDRTLFAWIRDPLQYLNRFFPNRCQVESELDSPLRILIVSAYLPHLGRHGGAGRVFQLLQRVSRRHSVSLVSFVETREELAEASQAAPFCRRLETVFRSRFEPVSPFPYEPFEEFNTLALREKLKELLSEEDFDLVHFEWTQMALYADLFPHTPKIVTEIEVNYAAHHSLVRVEPRPWTKIRKYYNTLQTLYRELELCRKMDRVVCVTDADRDYLAGYVEPSRIEVVNTGVDTSYFTPAPAHQIEPDSLVYVGAFRHEPNVDAMRYFCSQIFPRILEERPSTRLYIVGSSPPKELQRLEKSKNITVTGFVEDIRDYYHKAQVVVVPLRTGVGIRGKILEGWAAGKAMVATSLACLGIQAFHGENILIADTAADFAMWTLALLDNPDHCRRLGEAGRQVAIERYEWDELAGEMAALYEDVCGRRRPVRPPDESVHALKVSGAAVS